MRNRFIAGVAPSCRAQCSSKLSTKFNRIREGRNRVSLAPLRDNVRLSAVGAARRGLCVAHLRKIRFNAL